ncbi:hypothetical protein EHQ58_05900 [Leptospira ognonensis]|uniref:Uncharacterized protein n=1 Tax=Leptospira ognonensis TaxID=2484945 RepID=A0A4R9K9B7_9LEPT|nr:hypothetical protein [Leptospira ognonensis]TGL61308.1 hypothetical protein EHQ58_05900 [Leptospira ognonensis]
MNSSLKLKSIVCLLSIALLMHCRKDELDVIKTYSSIQNPIYGLVYFTLPGIIVTNSGGSSSGSTSSLPRGFKSSGSSLFAVGSSPSLYESTDGTSFTKKTFTLPNCTATAGSSSGSYTDCHVVSVAKFGSTIYAIGLKQSGERGSNGSQTTVTDHKFYFASGVTVNDLNFTEITDSTLTSTYYLSNSVLPSAASSNGFVFGFGVTSTSHKYCGTTNGSTWVCQNGVASSSSTAGAVELLNGTLAADIYYRWNGSGFTIAVTSNQGTKGSMIYASSRTIYTSGTSIRYTATDPSLFSGTSIAGETTATQTGGLTSGSYLWLGDFSGTLKVVGSSFSNNVTTLTAHTSSDNGSNWSNTATITIPGGLSPSNNIGSINNTVFVYAQSNSGTFTQKYFKSTDFTNWTEVTP